MKKIIPVLAIPVLAAVVLVGCGKNSPSSSTQTPSHNSSMGQANGMMGGMTNMAASHSMSNMDMTASQSMSKMEMAPSQSMSKMDMAASHSMSNMDMTTHPTQ